MNYLGNAFKFQLLIWISCLPDWAKGADQGEVIVVTGTRTGHSSWEAPIPTQSIAIDQARLRGKQTLADVLAEEPGIDLVPGIRGQTIRLQGFDSKYVLILIDGQRVTGEIGESFDLASIAAEQVERVEIIRGAASSLYGSDGIGGVVNVILRRPRRDRQDLRLRYGTDTARSLGGQSSLLGQTNDQSFLFNHSVQDPWRRSRSPASYFSGTQNTDLAYILNWNPSEDWSVKTRLGYQKGLIEGTDVSFAGAIWDRENQIQRSTVQISPEKRFDNGSRIKLESQYQDYTDIYKTVARLQTSAKTKEETRERLHEHTLSLQNEIGPAHLLTWGLTHIRERLESDRLADREAQRKRNAFFVQDEWSLHPRLTLVPGFRQDDDSQFGDHSSGKIAARFAVNAKTLVRTSYGEGYRAPGFKELYLRFENLSVGYVVIGNPKLLPETSRSFQLALDHRWTDESTVTAQFFRNDVADLIQASFLDGAPEGVQYYSYRNISNARTQGLDLSWRLREKFFETALTYQHLEAKDTTLDLALEGRSRNTIAVQLQSMQLKDRWQLFGSARWQGPQVYYVEGSAQKTSAALLAQAGTLYTWNSSWSTGFTIENLANSWEDRVLQIRPRSYILTLNWNHEKERT